MTKTLIKAIMEELVTKTTVEIITKKKKEIITKTTVVKLIINVTNTKHKCQKLLPKEKKVKTMGHITLFMNHYCSNG